MRALDFIREYEDLSTEKDNIIRTISGLDANDEQQAAMLDRIWKLLNSSDFNSKIESAFSTTTADEYMNPQTLEVHRRNVAEIISRLDSDYTAMNSFLKKLEGGGAINISELAKPVNSFNAVFDGDAVAMKAFNALKGYGVGEKQKGPGEFALAMLSNKIRLAQGEGDTEIDGIGKVEVKAAMGSKGSGGRLGHGGASQENQMNTLLKYEQYLPNLVASIQAKAGGTVGIGPFIDAMNAELPTSDANNVKLRKQIAMDIFKPNFGDQYGGAMANAFGSENREEIENNFVKQNFEWYKARDNFDAYLLVSFTRGKTGLGRTGDDIIKMKQAGHLGSFAVSIIPSKSAPREQFAQITVNAMGV